MNSSKSKGFQQLLTEDDHNQSAFAGKHGPKPKKTCWDHLILAVKLTFNDYLPSENVRNWKGNMFYLLGTIAYCAYAILFIYLLIFTFRSEIKSTFMSLGIDSGECNEVSSSFTGHYMASIDGKWEGQDEFYYNHGLYSFQFNNFDKNNSEFRHAFIDGTKTLNEIDDLMSRSPLVWNLLTYLYFSFEISQCENEQICSFAVEANNVFQRDYSVFHASNQSTSCLSLNTAYDVTLSTLILTASPTQDTCWGFISPLLENNVVFQRAIKNGIEILVPIQFNFISHSYAAAINYQVIQRQQLEFNKHILQFTYTDDAIIQVTKYNIGNIQYVDALYCYNNQNNEKLKTTSIHDLCLVEIEGIPMIPVLFHVEEACNECDKEGGEDEEVCNKIDVVLDYVHIPRNNYTDYISSGKKAEDYKTLLTLVDDIGYETLVNYVGEVNFFRDITNDDLSNSSLYRTCPTCAVFGILVYDGDNIVTKYGYELKSPHCNGIEDMENFEKLGNNPPSNLVEEYYECSPYFTDALLYSIGTAYSNSSSLGQLLLLFLIPLIYWMLRASVHTPKTKYRFNEEPYDDLTTAQATKELITTLLAIHDERSLKEKVRSDGVLVQLVRELHAVLEPTPAVHTTSDDDLSSNSSNSCSDDDIEMRVQSSSKDLSSIQDQSNHSNDQIVDIAPSDVDDAIESKDNQ